MVMAISNRVIFAMIAWKLVCGSPNMHFEGNICGGQEYKPGSYEQQARDLAIQDAVDNTPQTPGHFYQGHGVYYLAYSYALGECFGDISNDACYGCSKVCGRETLEGCPFNIRGSTTLKDCMMRFRKGPYIVSQ